MGKENDELDRMVMSYTWVRYWC